VTDRQSFTDTGALVSGLASPAVSDPRNPCVKRSPTLGEGECGERYTQTVRQRLTKFAASTDQNVIVTGTQLAIVLTAVVIGSLVKAVTGMGLPLIVVPIASLFVDVNDAVVVIALPNVLANVVLGSRERHSIAETRDLPALATAGIVGAVGGTLLFVNLPETPLVIALIIAICGYVMLFFVHPELRMAPRQSKRWAPIVGVVGGTFQGAIGISGPVFGSWIHSYRLPRSAHILSVTFLFFITGLTQLAILVTNGELSGRLTATLLACIPVLGSIPIGTRLRDRVSTRGFDLAIVAMLCLSVIALAARTIY
jgi:uncharacterized membrane protein YfcA